MTPATAASSPALVHSIEDQCPWYTHRLSSPLVFSLLPRCQVASGSHNKIGRSDVMVISPCRASLDCLVDLQVVERPAQRRGQRRDLGDHGVH